MTEPPVPADTTSDAGRVDNPVSGPAHSVASNAASNAANSAASSSAGNSAGPAHGSGDSAGGSAATHGELAELELPRVTVARYADYASAQQAVDHLSDNDFPIARTSIVGTDLRLVENVIGRMTVARAALAGAASGAWFGLLIGFVFTIFSTSAWWGVLATALVIGAIWGAVFGAIAHALTGGRRDFTSRSTLQAGQYAVVVDAEVSNEARALITRATWRTSGAS